MQAGINKLADAVGVTLGPRGSFATIVAANDAGPVLSGRMLHRAWASSIDLLQVAMSY